MAHKMIFNLSRLLIKGKRALLCRLLFSMALVAPVAMIAVYSYTQLVKESTDAILSKKRSLAMLSARVVQE